MSERMMYIPHLKAELTLFSPWTFTLEKESRNTSLMAKLEGFSSEGDLWKIGTDAWRSVWSKYPAVVKLPKNTVLVVDRIYIRQGGKQYDSLTFRIKECPENPTLVKSRFWASLDNVNNMTIK